MVSFGRAAFVMAALSLASGLSLGSAPAVAAPPAMSLASVPLACQAPSLIPSASAFRPVALHMVSRTTGWAYNASNVWWTDDGGRCWSVVTPPSLPHEADLTVDPVSADTAWVGADGLTAQTLLVTTTHGATWHHVSFPRVGYGSFDTMAFVSADAGWVETDAVGAGPVETAVWERTTDQGRHWHRLGYDGWGTLLRASPRVAWMGGGTMGSERATLFKTADGGRTWALVALPKDRRRTPSEATPLAFFGPRGVLLVELNDQNVPHDERPALAIYRTKNGGRTWQGGQVMMLSGGGQEAYASNGVGFLVSQRYGPYQVVTHGTLYRTRNWGRTWARTTWQGFAPRHLTALDLLTPRLGFAETGAGYHTFWITRDGGRVWLPLAPPNRAPP